MVPEDFVLNEDLRYFLISPQFDSKLVIHNPSVHWVLEGETIRIEPEIQKFDYDHREQDFVQAWVPKLNKNVLLLVRELPEICRTKIGLSQ